VQLRQLHHFEAVYRLRSFTQAAQEQFLTQSALSRSIRALETELRQPLFDRSTHEVEPTAAAHVLITHARDALSAQRAFEETATHLRGGGQGTVRLGTGPYPAQPLMTGVVRALSLHHPGLRVVIVGGAASDLLTALFQRELDFVVCDTSKFEDSPFAEDIEVVALPAEPLVFVVGADHPLASRHHIEPDQISEWPWALPPPAPGALHALAERFPWLTVGSFPTYEMETTTACLEVVRDQRSITLVPTSLAVRECRSRGLVFHPSGLGPRTNDGMHFLRARSRSAAAELAITATQTRAAELAAASDQVVATRGNRWSS